MPKIDTLIIIPAHNEAALVGDTVRDILNATQLPVVVVDDASTDDTATKARNAGAQLIPLATQLGAWGATQTGLRYALKNGYRNVVTIDADGQHDAQSINHLLTTMRSEDADLVIGSCTHRGSTARKTAWSLLRALSGLTMRDLTSGFRVYSHKGISLLAGRAATSLDYQDIGVLCLMNNAGMKIIETDVCMYPRADGKSRIFHSWLAVSQYMLYSAILAVSHMKHTKKKMIDYNITTATLGISTTACIFWLIRKYSIYIRYTVWWVFICAAVLVFSIFPQLSDILVHSLGISYAPAFFFLAAILMLFVKTLFMDIDRSKQEVRIRRLIQRVAMLEAKLEKHRSEAGNTTGK